MNINAAKLIVIIFLLNGVFFSYLSSDAVSASASTRKYTLDVDNVPLTEVLSNVSRDVNISFDIDESVSQDPISIKTETNSIDELIKRLLKMYNTVFTYTNNGEIISIKVESQVLSKTAIQVDNARKNILFSPDAAAVTHSPNQPVTLSNGGLIEPESNLLDEIQITPIDQISDIGEIVELTQVPDSEIPAPNVDVIPAE